MTTKEQNAFPLTTLDLGGEYELLFTVNMLHPYYENQVCRGIEITPTNETRDLLRNYHLLYRPVPGGLAILYGKKPRGKNLLQIDKAALKLSFGLQTTDKLFLNYTDLPYPQGREGYCFDNLTFTDWGQDSRLLHKAVLADGGQKQQIMPSVFSFPLDQPLENAEVKVVNSLGEEVVVMDNVNANQELLIKLNQEERDNYQLLINGNQVLNFHTFDYPSLPPFGIVDIHISDAIDKKMTVRSGGLLKSRNYIINFPARYTQWRYMVQVSPGSGFEGYSVIDTNGQVDFEDAALQSEIGRELYAITSTQPLPYREKAIEKFQLQMKKKGKDLLVTLDLRSAGPEDYKPVVGDASVYSYVYVYL